MNVAPQRRELAATLREMAASELSPGASGNISLRLAEGMLISPSGLPAGQAQPEHMVVVRDDGGIANGQGRPSSEWLMHQRIYQDHPQARAIVHCHSRFATVLACQRRPIPAFHYMVSVAGGVDIPCADYATFGSAELAENVSLALHRRKACDLPIAAALWTWKPWLPTIISACSTAARYCSARRKWRKCCSSSATTASAGKNRPRPI